MQRKVTTVPDPEIWNAMTITLVVSDRLSSEDEAFSPRIAALQQDIQKLVESYGSAAEWVSTSVTHVPTETSGQCTLCGAWTTDVMASDRAKRFKFSAGTLLEGKLLCDLCLPEDHPLHF